MVTGASAAGASSAPDIHSIWLAKLQENAVSEEDLLLGVVKSTSEKIEEAREKALEEAKETEISEDGTKAETTTASTDDIKAPSEVTSADLQSPIDIKL